MDNSKKKIKYKKKLSVNKLRKCEFELQSIKTYYEIKQKK